MLCGIYGEGASVVWQRRKADIQLRKLVFVRVLWKRGSDRRHASASVVSWEKRGGGLGRRVICSHSHRSHARTSKQNDGVVLIEVGRTACTVQVG